VFELVEGALVQLVALLGLFCISRRQSTALDVGCLRLVPGSVQGRLMLVGGDKQKPRFRLH